MESHEQHGYLIKMNVCHQILGINLNQVRDISTFPVRCTIIIWNKRQDSDTVSNDVLHFLNPFTYTFLIAL